MLVKVADNDDCHLVQPRDVRWRNRLTLLHNMEVKHGDAAASHSDIRVRKWLQ